MKAKLIAGAVALWVLGFSNCASADSTSPTITKDTAIAIRSAVSMCWVLDSEALAVMEPEELVTRLRIRLDLEGRLVEPIVVLWPENVVEVSQRQQAFIETATKAVRDCQPSASDHATWSTMELVFDARKIKQRARSQSQPQHSESGEPSSTNAPEAR